MKRLFICALAAASLASASATGQLDLRMASLLNSIEAPAARSASTASVPVIITLPEDGSAASLEEYGVEVRTVIDRYVTATVPVSAIEAMVADGVVDNMVPARKIRQLNNKARSASNVDDVHNGVSPLPGSFDGKGVYVGIFDSGFEPNHINFLDENGASRVEDITLYKLKSYPNGEYSFTTTTYNTPDKIAAYTTDDVEGSHGTHVLGVAAGSYTGGKTDYSGMAPGAGIFISAGDALDDALIDAVDKMITKAEYAGKPIVINLSLGTNVGHHDGSDAFCKALDKLAERAPICLAAGNEADLNVVVKKRLTADDKSIKTFLVPNIYAESANDYYQQYYGYNFQAYGSLEIIGPDSEPFTVKMGLYDTDSDEMVYTFEANTSSYTYLGGSRCGKTGHKSDTNFANTYTSESYIGGAKGLCKDNDRYFSLVDFKLFNKKLNPAIKPVIIVEGKEGKLYEVYGDAFYTDFSACKVPGFDSPTTDGTINDMACGKNTIAVGAYVTANAYPSYTGNTIGDVSNFSSWGNLSDGRKLPHFCAPGVALTSSVSRYWVENSDDYDKTADPVKMKVTDDNGDVNYWLAMGGTSMACPAAVGIMALWLQANPELTPAEIRDIAIETAKSDDFVTSGKVSQSPVQWGAGKIDALVGIKRALNMTALPSVSIDTTGLVITPVAEGVYDIFTPGNAELDCRVVNLAGATAMHLTGRGNLTVDTTTLPAGIYVISATDGRNTNSTKVAVR